MGRTPPIMAKPLGQGLKHRLTGVAPLSILLFALLFCLVLLAGCSPEHKPEPAQPEGRITVYFNNDRLSEDEPRCDLVFPVSRPVPTSQAGAEAALSLLFRGPTPEERALDYRSLFSPRSAGLLKRLKIQAGTAYVDLHEPPGELTAATSSCGSAEFFSQIERTLGEFPQIRRFRYAIEGDPAAFHNWMESECSELDDRCDPAPFASP